jgi:hypothetical protein
MNRFLPALAIAATFINQALAADVHMTLSIGEPGYYGQLNPDAYGRPSVINDRPSLVKPAPPGVVREPLYLLVPPSHSKSWRKYCAGYNACDRSVYFVRDDWYNKVYVPKYREQHREHHRDWRGDQNDQNDLYRGDDDRRDRGEDHERHGS